MFMIVNKIKSSNNVWNKERPKKINKPKKPLFKIHYACVHNDGTKLIGILISFRLIRTAV